MVKHKQEVISSLRGAMEREDNPECLCTPSLDLGGFRIDEFLDTKFQEDGRTLLMHAAALGKETCFLYFAERIRYRVRTV